MQKKKSLDLKFRILDLFLILITGPMLLLILSLVAIFITVLQGSPIFHLSERVTPGGTFKMLKFRSMVASAPILETTPEMSKYVTPVGRFIRKSSVDEIPQIINVLCGSMSLVGPRPCLPSQVDLIEMRRQYRLNEVRPGITGLAQIRGRDCIPLRRKVRYEKFYSDHRSIGLYFWILGSTIKSVFFAKGVRY